MSADAIHVLAAADPARDLERLTPAELAERRALIPTPVGVREATRRRFISFRTVAIAVLVLVVIASGAVASGFQPWHRDVDRQVGPGVTGVEANNVFQREYRAAQQALVLPPGARWPARSIPGDTVIMTGRGGQGEGTAVVIAITDWSCYVVAEHRAGRLGSARAAALSLADLIRTHVVVVPDGTPEDGAAPSDIPGPVAQFADDGGKELLLRGAADAANGDIGILAQSCRANGAERKP